MRVFEGTRVRQQVETLPAADQRAVLKLVDALVETRRRTQARPRATAGR